jgi:hypothetical protein
MSEGKPWDIIINLKAMYIHTTISTLLALWFGSWLLISVLCQIPGKFSDLIQRVDIFNLIPRWNFFAPSPGTYDVHLLFRDRLPDDTFSPWKEISGCRHTPYFSMIWNPGRRHNKAMFDVTRHIADIASHNQESPEKIQVSIPYITILNFVSARKRKYYACQTQFLLMRSYNRATEKEPTVIFTSSLHDML